MRLASPGWLWLLTLVPLVAALAVWRARRGRRALALVIAPALWARVAGPPAVVWRRWREALLAVTIAAAALALARPQWGLAEHRVERRGVDVAILIDTSPSMFAADVPPSRAFWARAAARAVLGSLRGDRAALVVFERVPRRLVPLTSDLAALYTTLDLVEPGIASDPGTLLAPALDEAIALFPPGSRKHRVVVVISDGEDQGSDVAAALERCRHEGVVVHTIAVGTLQGAPIPLQQGSAREYKRDEDGEVVVSRVRLEVLREAARATGGEALTLGASQLDVSAIATAIAGMEKRRLASRYYADLEERFPWPLGLAALALALRLAIPAAPRRRRAAAAEPTSRRRKEAA